MIINYNPGKGHAYKPGYIYTPPIVASAVFTDDFNRADGNLEVSANWTFQNGTAGNLKTASNVITTASAALNSNYTAPDTGSVDHFCQLQLLAQGTNYSMVLLADYVDTTNYTQVYGGTSTGLQVSHVINGTTITVLSSGGIVTASADVIRVECVGPTLTVYKNGFVVYKCARMHIGATLTGIRSPAAANATADNFTCGSLSPLSYSLTFKDYFNRTAGTLLEANAAWTRVDGTKTGGLVIDSTGAYITGTSTATYPQSYLAPDTTSQNHFVQFNCAGVSVATVLAFSDFIDANNYTYLSVTSNTLQYTMIENVGGIQTSKNIGSTNAGYLARFESAGPIGRVFINGAPTASSSVPRYAPTSLTGLGATSTAQSTAKLDNFVTGSITDPNAPVFTFYDGFNRTSGTALEASTDWTLQFGTASSMTINVSGYIVGSNTGLYTAPDTGSANHFVQAMFPATGTTNFLALVVDYVDNNNWMLVYKKSTAIYSRTMTAGVLAAEVNTGYTAAAGTMLRCDCIGGVVYLFVDSFLSGTIVRPFTTATKVGVYTTSTAPVSTNGTMNVFGCGKTGPYAYGFTTIFDGFDRAADNTALTSQPSFTGYPSAPAWTLATGAAQLVVVGGKCKQISNTNSIYTTAATTPVTTTNKFVQVDFADRGTDYTCLLLFDYSSTTNFSYVAIAEPSHHVVYATGYSLSGGGTENDTGFIAPATGPVTLRVECISGFIIIYCNGQFVGRYTRGTATLNAGFVPDVHSQNQTVDNFMMGTLY